MISNRIAIFFGLLVFCFGCSPPDEKVGGSRSLPELAESVIADSEEFNFLLSEDAGSDSYERCVDQIKPTLDSLSESLPSSDDARAEKLAAAVEDAKDAYETLATAVKSNSSAAKMSKANSRFRQKSKVIFDYLK